MTDQNRASANLIRSELLSEDASFVDIVVPFVEGLADRLKTMEHAVRAADFEALRAAAHQLKGSGGGYGYPSLTERAAELERNAKSYDLDDCLASFEELKELCSRIVVSEEETKSANSE